MLDSNQLHVIFIRKVSFFSSVLNEYTDFHIYRMRSDIQSYASKTVYCGKKKKKSTLNRLLHIKGDYSSEVSFEFSICSSVLHCLESRYSAALNRITAHKTFASDFYLNEISLAVNKMNKFLLLDNGISHEVASEMWFNLFPEFQALVIAEKKLEGGHVYSGLMHLANYMDTMKKAIRDIAAVDITATPIASAAWTCFTTHLDSSDDIWAYLGHYREMIGDLVANTPDELASTHVIIMDLILHANIILDSQILSEFNSMLDAFVSASTSIEKDNIFSVMMEMDKKITNEFVFMSRYCLI